MGYPPISDVGGMMNDLFLTAEKLRHPDFTRQPPHVRQWNQVRTLVGRIVSRSTLDVLVQRGYLVKLSFSKDGHRRTLEDLYHPAGIYFWLRYRTNKAQRDARGKVMRDAAGKVIKAKHVTERIVRHFPSTKELPQLSDFEPKP